MSSAPEEEEELQLAYPFRDCILTLNFRIALVSCRVIRWCLCKHTHNCCPQSSKRAKTQSVFAAAIVRMDFHLIPPVTVIAPALRRCVKLPHGCMRAREKQTSSASNTKVWWIAPTNVRASFSHPSGTTQRTNDSPARSPTSFNSFRQTNSCVAYLRFAVTHSPSDGLPSAWLTVHTALTIIAFNLNFDLVRRTFDEMSGWPLRLTLPTQPILLFSLVFFLCYHHSKSVIN